MSYTPTKTKVAEKKVAEQWVAQGGPQFGPDLSLEVIMMFDTEGVAITVQPIETVEKRVKLRGDIDNYVKLILDALNENAWTDDRQIVRIVAVKM